MTTNEDLPVKIGLTLSSEEHGPNDLIELGVEAEARGFDFVSVSDHFHPWLPAQGHSPFVWAVLGGLAARTSEIEVGVGVTCPIMRMHPVIAAHAAATAACLLDGRFSFGVGTGEALNEHITGERWPPAGVRLEMLDEAIDVMRQLWAGGSTTHHGEHFTVENATIYDLPDAPFPLIVSAFGPEAASLAARRGDGLWITGTGGEALERWRAEGGSGPVWSQLTFSYDEDVAAAHDRAATLWANTAVAGQLSQDLPTTFHFEQASSHVSADNIADHVPCGPDPEPVLDAVRDAVEAGVDHIYLHQIGHDLGPFLDWWDRVLRDAVSEIAASR